MVIFYQVGKMKKTMPPLKILNVKKKLRDWCEENGMTVQTFLANIEIPQMQWYRFLKGNMPYFSTVSKIVHGTKGYISFRDFELALELIES